MEQPRKTILRDRHLKVIARVHSAIGKTVGITVLAASLLFGVASSAVGQGQVSTTAQHRPSSPYATFPLWKDVPGKKFAVLGDGQLKKGTRWAVYASRVGQSGAAHMRPCISVARITRDGIYGHAGRCAALAPNQAGTPALYVAISGSGRERPDGPVIGETVMGLSFKPSVHKVMLRLADGREVLKPTKTFNGQQMKKTGLTRFSYLASGLQEDVCVQEVVGYESGGHQILASTTGLC